MRRISVLLMTVVLLGLLARGATADVPGPITVFAAASLGDVLQEIGDRYTSETGRKLQFSFAATSMLARQIENGARADLFLSADQEWMDYLEQRHLIRSATRARLLGNRLALVAAADSAIALTIGPQFPLLQALQGGRLAVADPDSVPAGRYAHAALASLGVWDALADRLARAENVRGALAFVARGEAPLGIVYETDARADRSVRIVGLFPADSHPAIVYPVALTRDAAPGAAAFLDYLRSAGARAAFTKYGFDILF